MPDVTIRWAGATDAVAATDYRVESDEGASGTFVALVTQDATDRGDGSYSPYNTTLNGAITATDVSIVFTSATNFSDGDYVVIDNELILLGGKSGDTFATCTRAQGGTLPIAHANGATIYQAHESYTDTAPTWGSRSVIRYHVIRITGTDESVPIEMAGVNPPAPPDDAHCTVYGIVEDIQGNPLSGVQVQLTMTAAGDYGQESGEAVRKETETDTTDADGFFHFFVRKDKVRQGPGGVGATYTITVDSGVEANKETFSITSIPDQDSLHYKRA